MMSILKSEGGGFVQHERMTALKVQMIEENDDDGQTMPGPRVKCHLAQFR